MSRVGFAHIEYAPFSLLIWTWTWTKYLNLISRDQIIIAPTVNLLHFTYYAKKEIVAKYSNRV